MNRISAARDRGDLDFDDCNPSLVPPLAVASSSAASTSSPNRKKLRKQQGTLNTHMSITKTMSSALLAELNLLLITFIVGCGLSFLIVDSVFFIGFITLLNPSYAKVFPRRKALSRTWLPKLYSDTRRRVIDLFERNLPTHPLRTLALDAVKTPGGDVVNITESCGPLVAFRKAVTPGKASQNAKFYSNAIIDTIKQGAREVGKNPKDVYCSVVMDNTTTNLAAFAIATSEHPWLICQGCIPHFFDLVIEDVFGISEFHAVLKEVQ
jgi:hypothetical protein